MIVRSLYIVQSQVISLSQLPFLDKKVLRSHFVPIFSKKDCFTQMRQSILHPRRPDDAKVPSTPFIKNMGQVCFDVNSIRLAQYRGSYPKIMPGGMDGEIVAENLARREEYWDPQAKPQKNKHWYNPRAFGYAPDMEDQRMNFLYFQTRRPFYIRSFANGQTVADGHIYLHLFPSGYLVLNINIALKNNSLETLETIQNAFRATQPWRYDNPWIWHSKLGKMPLPDLVRVIKEKVSGSLYKDAAETFGRESDWYYIVKAIANVEAPIIANALSPQEQSELTFWYNMESLHATKKGVVCTLSETRSQKSAMRFFRKIFLMHEYVLLKNQIYTDYTEFLRPEISQLKQYRLSTKQKILEDDLFKFSVYNSQAPTYLLHLDSQIRTVSAYYRRIYSFLSRTYGFDERREKVKGLVKQWEAEVEKWEPTLQVLWEKVIAPLRTLITKFPF